MEFKDYLNESKNPGGSWNSVRKSMYDQIDKGSLSSFQKALKKFEDDVKKTFSDSFSDIEIRSFISGEINENIKLYGHYKQ